MSDPARIMSVVTFSLLFAFGAYKLYHMRSQKVRLTGYETLPANAEVFAYEAYSEL